MAPNPDDHPGRPFLTVKFNSWKSLGLLPVVGFLVLMVVLYMQGGKDTFESPDLLAILNTIFLCAIPLAGAYFASISYRRTGVLAFLLIGCGLVFLGFSSLYAGWVMPFAGGPNPTVTLHNLGTLFAGICLSISAHLIIQETSGLRTVRKAIPHIGLLYTAIFLAISLIAVLAFRGDLPLFFSAQTGATSLRQLVLGTAILLIAAAGLAFVETFSVIKTSFAWWFGLALWLIALGLACVLVQESVGSALGWTGRAAQYMGCVYFIIAFFVAQREQTSLDGTGSQNPAWSLWPYLEQRVAERTTELAQFNSALQTEIHERNKLETSLRESELKHRRMTANISDVIAIMSSAGTLSYKSPNIETYFGWLPEDLVGTNGWATVHPDDLQRIQKEFVALLGKDNTKKSVEYRYLCKDGSYKMIALTAINLSNDPTINGVLMNYRDITEQKKAEEALKMSEEQYRNLVDFLPSGVMVYRAGKIILANQTIARVFGANDPSELIGTALVERVHPDYVDSMTNLVRKLIQESGETPWGEVKLLRMDGSSFDAEVSVMTSIYHYSPVLISVINDITERKQAEEQIRLMNAELQSLAVTDFLTKLPNRRYLIERGDEEFKRSRRYHQALTFFMIDIDHFKDINDRFGHEAGDQVLQQIAAILKSNLREIDIPARVGGEEFVVMLVNTTLKDATCLAERIRVAIAETVYHAQSQEIRCTASLGVALLSDDMVDLDKLMRTADDAMYRAKQAGRNRVMY